MFPNCVWAPSEKRGGGSWPFWSKILQICDGDVVIHLRGIPPSANFVGYSTAFGNGFSTTRRPPDPGKWGFSERYYRANLTNFVPFHQPINLNDLFAAQRPTLEKYFYRNRARGVDKSNIFYVKQAQRLQCLNGAYLSDIDEELFDIIFDHNGSKLTSKGKERIISVETDSQISIVRYRLGQSKFANEVKRLYSSMCCFPGCSVADPRFLVASHIARWSDNEELRGHLGNGLCLCVFHDRAFELGIFTLDDRLQVFVNPRERNTEYQFLEELALCNGKQIRLSDIRPLQDALLEHRDRTGIHL